MVFGDSPGEVDWFHPKLCLRFIEAHHDLFRLAIFRFPRNHSVDLGNMPSSIDPDPRPPGTAPY